MFGKSYSQPFGISPVALCNFVWPDSDSALAKLAATRNIPFVLSMLGSSSIKSMAKIVGDKLWFQVYVLGDPAIREDLLRRAWEAGVKVLVLTVDAIGARRHNMSIRYDHPKSLIRRGKRILDAALHPGWALRTLSRGSAEPGNFKTYDSLTRKIFAEADQDDGLTWDDLKRIRELWKGKLVIKGILNAEDAKRAVQEGADGIWISTHGGRQLESLPAAVTALPAIRAALDPSVPVIIDFRHPQR